MLASLIALDWYGLFAIFIPVYLFLQLPILASLGMCYRLHVQVTDPSDTGTDRPPFLSMARRMFFINN